MMNCNAVRRVQSETLIWILFGVWKSYLLFILSNFHSILKPKHIQNFILLKKKLNSIDVHWKLSCSDYKKLSIKSLIWIQCGADGIRNEIKIGISTWKNRSVDVIFWWAWKSVAKPLMRPLCLVAGLCCFLSEGKSAEWTNLCRRQTPVNTQIPNYDNGIVTKFAT